MEQFSSDEKEEIINIFTDITDLNYKIFFRTCDKGILIHKIGEYDDEMMANSSARINYGEISDSLMEVVDRLKDLYDIEKILFSNTSSDRSVKYKEVPDSISFPCIGITIILLPKSKLNRIKSFLNFKI